MRHPTGSAWSPSPTGGSRDLTAGLHRPAPRDRYQFARHATVLTLSVDALAVLESVRRGGVATALMSAAHRWGAGHGAVLVMLDTYAHSPLSMPFYEQRMGYTRRAIIFDRAL